MEEGSSSRLSHRTRVDSHDSASSAKSPAVEAFISLEAGEPHPSDAAAAAPRSYVMRSLATRFPRLARCADYVRGPGVKSDLPDLVPLLDRDFQLRKVHIVLRLETLLTRSTRRLTTPLLYAILAAGYIIASAFLSRAQSFTTPASSFASCTSTFWLKDDGCGLDGQGCLPFSNRTYDLRCPAGCTSVILQNPRTVGDDQIDYKPLIVGGGDTNGTYRGDSFICAAAVHAGMVDDHKGGCFSVQMLGNFTDFLPSTAHGLTSIGFPTIFPQSFRFSSSTSLTQCTDIRTPALAFNAIITAVIFLVLRPKPLVLYWSLVCIGFWHITLFSQPRSNPPDLSDAFGTFLPTLFIAYGFWRLAYRFVLPTFATTAPIEGTLLYLFPFWIGVLENLTFDNIPIDRLTASDINKRPGGLIALVVICAVLLVLVVNQARVIRRTGFLPQYLGWYVCGGLLLLVLALLPGLQLRIHHYIIAMALVPGTAWPTRLGAVYQGLLLGMFLNGAAAWGFDSILQTAAQLQRDGPSGSALPALATNAANFNASVPLAEQVLAWAPLADGWDGYALLVDDVERYVGTALSFPLASLQAGIPHFFRLAYTSEGSAGDFTMPAAIWPNGTFVDPLPGPS